MLSVIKLLIFLCLYYKHFEFYLGRNDHGQLGVGDKLIRNTPTIVPLPTGIGNSKAIKVATGNAHSLILFSNGQVSFQINYLINIFNLYLNVLSYI